MFVTGLGQCSLDCIVVVDGFPREDTKKEVEAVTVEGGGPAATAMVALSRLGVATALMGRVSDDDAGRAIRRGLRAEGVDTRWLRTEKGGLSQRAFIVADRARGTRTIFWRRPTTAPLRPGEVAASVIRRSDFLLVDGLMMDASLHAAALARAFSVPVMVDAGRVRPGMMRLLGLCDYIVASEEFAGELAPTSRGAIDEVLALRGKEPPRAVTVTLGGRGSETWCAGRFFHTPAYEVEVVDTTGAGDVFHGGYIYGLLRRWPIRRTVRFASALAALKCRAAGGRAAIATLEETLAFMERASTVRPS